RGEDVLRAGAVGGQEALFLALEMLVEGDRRDTREGAQRFDAHRLVSALGRQRDHRVHQPLALAALQRPARHPRIRAAIARRGGRLGPCSRPGALTVRRHTPQLYALAASPAATPATT